MYIFLFSGYLWPCSFTWYFTVYRQVSNISRTKSQTPNAYRNIPIRSARCAKAHWRALLFRAILCVMGAFIVCVTDIWLFQQADTRKTCCLGCHCDLEQRMSCLSHVFVYWFVKVRTRRARCFCFVGALLFCNNIQTHLGGASIR